jgi:uncharacterized protein (TIGR02145 family)
MLFSVLRILIEDKIDKILKNKHYLTVVLLLIVFVVACISQEAGDKDQDGNKFNSVKIGNQVWMSENLRVSTFRNGDVIPKVTSEADWKRMSEEKKPAWCYYNFDRANEKKYGKLYNWYAINDPRGISPIGWHVPNNSEWTTLTEYLGADKVCASMKSTDGWVPFYTGDYYKNPNGTNLSGFNGLPAGGCQADGRFLFQGTNVYWWSATECNDEAAYSWELNSMQDFILKSPSEKGGGSSVRCLHD